MTPTRPVPWNQLAPDFWPRASADERAYLRALDALAPPRALTAHLQIVEARDGAPHLLRERALQTLQTSRRQALLHRAAANQSSWTLRPALGRLIERALQEGLRLAHELRPGSAPRVRVSNADSGGVLDQPLPSPPVGDVEGVAQTLLAQHAEATPVWGDPAWPGLAHCVVDCADGARCVDLPTTHALPFAHWKRRGGHFHQQPAAYDPRRHDVYALVQIFVGNATADAAAAVLRRRVDAETLAGVRRFGLNAAQPWAALSLNGSCLAVDPVVLAPASDAATAPSSVVDAPSAEELPLVSATEPTL